MPVGTRDAEAYLRCAFERVLLGLDGDQGPFFANDLLLAGRAFVAAGAIDPTVVHALVEEYHLAARLRGRHVAGPFVAATPGPAATLVPARVCFPARTYTVAGATRTLEQVLLDDEQVTLRLTGTTPGGTPRRPRGGIGRGAPSRPGPGATLSVTDDRGTTVQAQQGAGSWGGGTWETEYRSDAPIAPDTAWIEIEGARIELPAPSPVPDHALEARPSRRSLEDVLLGALFDAVGGPPHGRADEEEAMRALVTCGVLGADDPLLGAVREAAGRLASHAASPARRTTVPEPWRGVLARVGARGVEGVAPLGSVVEVGGCSLRLEAIVADPDGFMLQVTASPASALAGRGAFWRPMLDDPPITWWAEDDRHNTYYGVPGNWQGGENRASGQIDYFPALDPGATELRLAVTAPTERAILAVPLDHLTKR